MKSSPAPDQYVWQCDWPNWTMDMGALISPLERVCKAQGELLGRLQDAGLYERNFASVATLTSDVLKSNEIEGEQLNEKSVQSSIARRLGVDIGALTTEDRSVDGV